MGLLQRQGDKGTSPLNGNEKELSRQKDGKSILEGDGDAYGYSRDVPRYLGNSLCNGVRERGRGSCLEFPSVFLFSAFYEVCTNPTRSARVC